MSKFVYVVFGDFSGKKRVGLRSRSEIVDIAEAECFSEGSTLEEFAGIPYSEDGNGNFHYTRHLEGPELFRVAVKKLNDDGRFFVVFDTDGEGVSAFLGFASLHGLEQNARLLLDQN
jgi:hypothetical protein